MLPEVGEAVVALDGTTGETFPDDTEPVTPAAQ